MNDETDVLMWIGDQLDEDLEMWEVRDARECEECEGLLPDDPVIADLCPTCPTCDGHGELPASLTLVRDGRTWTLWAEEVGG